MTQQTYYCVFKMKPGSVASAGTYQANGVMEAISGMMKLAGVDDTSKIAEFEIMEVISTGANGAATGYKPVACRLPSKLREKEDKQEGESTPVQLSLAPQPPLDSDKLPAAYSRPAISTI